MNKITIYLSVLTLLVLPAFAEAGPILRSGDSISVDAAQSLNGDFYGFAPTVSISGPASNDVYIGGGTVTINAPVAGDLSVAAGVVQIHGEVSDDVRIIGGEVTIAELVKGDVVVLGGILTILSTAVIEGDVLFLGNDLVIEGDVTGGIHGSAQNVRINSKVGGDVLVTAQSLLTLGDKADVLGSITYESNGVMVRAQDAQIGGEVRRTDSPLDTSSGFLRFQAFWACISLFTALALYFILRKYVEKVIEESNRSIGISGLIGLGLFIVIPFVSVVLAVSVLGALAGIMLFLLFSTLFLSAIAFSGILVGVTIQRAFKKSSAVSLSTVIGGSIALFLLSLVPYIGELVVFGFTLIVFGGIATVLYRAIRS